LDPSKKVKKGAMEMGDMNSWRQSQVILLAMETFQLSIAKQRKRFLRPPQRDWQWSMIDQ
jgi:hypothetical protein